MDIEDTKERILASGLFGPALKSQLVEQLHNIDGERRLWIGILIDRAEAAHRTFGEKSAEFKRIMDEIEASALSAAEREAQNIFAQFEKELAGLKH